MRIACLQFAPQVGDVSNNMARAEAVLSKADSDDLENLDLMVLPEMAFSGMTPGGWLSSQTDFPRIQLQVARAHLAPR
jgi:predicted amidohydrolase